jgi:hypothetical protein
MGHIISFSVTLGLMIAVNLYMLYCAIKKRKGYKYRYIPFCITVLAGCLIMADLLRHVLADYHIWKPGPFPGSSQYRPNCDKENISCLSFTGVLFTIIFTYTGFILLFIGTMWNANIIEKLKLIKKKWRQIRNQQKKNDKLNTINGSFYEILTKKEGESWNYNYIEQHFLIVGKKGKLFLNEFLN